MSDINRILALSGLAQNGINVRAAVGEAAKVEAVGDSAEAFYELQDEFCGGECPSDAHKAFIDEIARWMTGDQVADFVDHVRRHYDMNETEENVEESDSELSVMANSRDKVESTYAAIIKGDAEQTEVGDYIGHGMTKDQILKLIDMLEPQGYDKDFLLKDLAPMMEAGGDKVDNSELSRILKLSGLEVSEDRIDDEEELDEKQEGESSSEYIFLNAEKGGIRVGGPGRTLYGWADNPKELSELFAKLGVNNNTRIMHSSDVDFASEEGFEDDGDAHDLIGAALKMMENVEESNLQETTKKLKDELINELMGD